MSGHAHREPGNLTPQPNSTRILVVVQRPLLRFGITALLRQQVPAYVEEAENLDQLLSATSSQHWDLLVLGLLFDGAERLDILQTVTNLIPDLPVLVLTPLPEESCGVRAIRAGAYGYLSVAAPIEDFKDAVATLLRRQKYISAALAHILIESTFAEGAPHTRLSNREYQVMLAMASGQRVKDIASHLQVSKKTISTFRRRTFQKLGISTVAALTQYVQQSGLQ
jgi:two-component system, NarL family, invasion response regulator UvrY